jgi:quinol monooxygenase YgiN
MHPLLPSSLTPQTPKKGDKTDDKDLVHVIVRYTVAPSQAGDFEKLWDAAAKGVEGEEGSHIYSLRRVFETNWQFYTYGTWDSWKAYHSHFE